MRLYRKGKGLIKYIWEFFKKPNVEHVERINEELLKDDMPVTTHGVLYMDGEGTATAEVAKKAAELFNAGHYSHVVMAGSVKPRLDIKSLFVFPKLKKQGLPKPSYWKQREAEYLRDVFKDNADKDKYEALQAEGRIHVIPKGNNAGAKVAACKPIFEEAGLVHGVTLAYSLQRLIWTMYKQALDSGEGNKPSFHATGTRV